MKSQLLLFEGKHSCAELDHASLRGEVLVAILNSRSDLDILREKHWYRIPVSSVERWLKKRWPPHWLAFYQTKAFQEEKYAVRYLAEVIDIRKAYRWELFPGEPDDGRRDRQYYQLFVQSIQCLPKPILSRRFRRIVFIPTTWEKFVTAAEINDLYDESSLEDRLWAELKRLQIPAERQEFVRVNRNYYALDFAVYCADGKMDVETDGEPWHAQPERAAQDKLRDRDLESLGWRVIRLNSYQVQEQMEEYCVKAIVDSIDSLGGLKTEEPDN